MKKIKITAVLLISIMLILPFSSAVYALDLDNILAFGELIGFGSTTTTQPSHAEEEGTTSSTESARLSDILQREGLRKVFGSIVDRLSNSQIRELFENFNIGSLGDISGFFDEIMDYINAFETTTLPTTTQPETTTAPETTTEEPATEAPTARPYVNPTQSSTPSIYVPSASETETTSFTYIPPEQIYTNPLTTSAFSPIIQDENNSEDGVTIKTVIGIAILILSGFAVIFVAVKLKNNRI